MKIISIEPTPSPNTMKIILDQELPTGKSHNYKKQSQDGAPEKIKAIFEIDGVKGVYHVADFLAVERSGKVDWKGILTKVRMIFGEDGLAQERTTTSSAPHYGEVRAEVQLFKGIPLQVKLSDGETEKRFGLPDLYKESAFAIQLPGENYILLRKWQDWGTRYGDMDEVGREIVDELLAAFPEERVKNLILESKNGSQNIAEDLKRPQKKIEKDDFTNEDWRVRYRALQQMQEPTVTDLPLLEISLKDEKMSIRRLATVYIGMVKDKKGLPLLYKALHDQKVAVRRTAGDCLSDLGFEEAIPQMCAALKDSSKLVRWRAAMFLYELGDKSSLSALKEAENDPEFEVSLQVKMAIERIEGGEAAKGSVWKQMTESRKAD